MDTVGELASKKIVTVSALERISEVTQLMAKRKIGSVIVMEDNAVVGIFTGQDFICKANWNDPVTFMNKTVGEVMTKNVKTVDYYMSYIDVVTIMQEEGFRHMPVTKNGMVMGIVSLTDLAFKYNKSFDETLDVKSRELSNAIKKIGESGGVFKALFDNAVIAVTFADEKERLIAWNPYAAELLKYSDRQLMQKPIKDLYSSSAWDEIKSKHLSQESKISHFETKMQDRKGNLIDVDLSLVTVKDEAGNICGSMGIAKDISYKKNMQNALLKKERRYRRLVDLLSQTVFTMNDKFKIAYINNAGLKLFKYSRDEFERRGMHFQDMISYEDISKVKEKISDMLRGNKESDRIECEAISRDKTKFPIMIFINKVLEGDEIAFQGIVVDITQRRKLERIQQDWVGVVSHELRTPLVPIREGVSQVLDGVLGEINASQKEFLSIVLQEIDRLKRIVDNLLNLFKFEVEGTRLERKAVDVALTAKKIATSFFPKAQSKNIDIKIRIPKEKISIYADEDKLSQVFANLIGNAVKFTEKGAITVGIKKRLRYLEYFVQDTGHGISENDLPRLFKRFQMLKTNAKFGEPGTGLGLAICKDIVEAHGGKIEAASQIGKGTKITFKLKMHNPFELFQENTADFLNSAITQGFKFSVSSVKVSFPKTLEPSIRNKRISMFADVLNQYLKSKNLVVENFLINKNTLYFLFPDEHGKEIYDTMKNIENVLKFSISDSTVFLGLKMKIMVLSIPEDVQDIKDVFKKLG